MSRRPKIRVTSRDKALLRNINKKVSAKKSRIKNKYGMFVDVQTKSIKDFKTRAEFNAYRDQMNSFLNPHNQSYQYHKTKGGAVVTKKEYNETQRALKRINRIKEQETKRLRNKPFMQGKKPTQYTVGEQEKLMGDVRYKDNKPLKNKAEQFKDRESFIEWANKLEKNYKGDWITKRNEDYRDNYIKGLQNVFTAHPERVEMLKQHIERLTLPQFMEFYYSNTIGNIGYIYLPTDQSAKLERIERVFYT
ncbi:MAG: hypothetical protein HF308_17145 [Ignavibacteria bacterium]|jgi:hypothetical protein|nr:hypothetical protein [Ignavibacteria bacterium]